MGGGAPFRRDTNRLKDLVRPDVALDVGLLDEIVSELLAVL